MPDNHSLGESFLSISLSIARLWALLFCRFAINLADANFPFNRVIYGSGCVCMRWSHYRAAFIMWQSECLVWSGCDLKAQLVHRHC